MTKTASWKPYFKTIIESILAIYAASFVLGLFFLHRGENWIIPAILLGSLYAFIVVISIKRIITKLPMAGIMIAAPTIPLILLLLALSLLPILQYFK